MKRAEGCIPTCEFRDGVGALDSCTVICQRLRWDTIGAGRRNCPCGVSPCHENDHLFWPMDAA